MSTLNLKVNNKNQNTILPLCLTLHNPSKCPHSRVSFQVVKFSQVRGPVLVVVQGQKQRQQKKQLTCQYHKITRNYTKLNYTTFIPIRQKSHETAVAIVSLLLFFDCLFDCSDCFYFSCFFNHVTHFPSLTSCSNELVNFMLACCWPISPSSHKNLGARPHRRTLPS